MKDEKPHFQHPQQQTTQPIIAGNTPQPPLQGVPPPQLTRINLATDILGLFQTVTAAPTQVPNSPYEQVQIYNNSGTLYLYIYDNVGGAWHYTSLT